MEEFVESNTGSQRVSDWAHTHTHIHIHTHTHTHTPAAQSPLNLRLAHVIYLAKKDTGEAYWSSVCCLVLWGWQRMRWLNSITHSIDMNLSKLQETVKDREAWHAVVHRVTKSWTQLTDWTTTSPIATKKPSLSSCCSFVLNSPIEHTWSKPEPGHAVPGRSQNQSDALPEVEMPCGHQPLSAEPQPAMMPANQPRWGQSSCTCWLDSMVACYSALCSSI